jgi:non-specific serine/threonine protein kinase/serine/threonine-protein kinase
VKRIFVEACEKPPREREPFLREACGDDEDLLREVHSLLRFHDEPETGPVDGPTPDLSEESSVAISGYRLMGRVGEGGMGEVYEAEQLAPVRRRVAVKVIRAGMNTGQVVTRFEAERQALAIMDHPAIARVYDAGATEQGLPFFAMEFVPGEPITGYCDRCRLTTDERLALFVRLCDGVAHAHRKGIIHRDIKPSNVLVRELDDRPTPTIIDFGIAKATLQPLTEETMYTAMGMVIGTPEYMSPEQADIGAGDIDTRTDVYSLGVLLYELLVGALPFERARLRETPFDQMLRTIREDEPSKPSTRLTTLGDASAEAARQRSTDTAGLRRRLRGDLDWITMKALEKDPDRRYASAADLAADIGRHLRHEPVLAGPPRVRYRMGKFVRRHLFGVVAATAVLLALVGGIVGTTVGLVQARREAERARRVAGSLQEMLNDLNPGTFRGRAEDSLDLQDRFVARIETDLANEPVIQAGLLRNLGMGLTWRGSYDRARPLYERALALQREHLGPEHAEIAATLARLGNLLALTGDLDESRRVLEGSLAMSRRVLDPGARQIGWTASSLGFVLWRLGRNDEALARYDEALALQASEERGPRVDMATTLQHRGWLRLEAGEPERAREDFDRALAIKEELLGEDHAEVGSILVGLGSTHRILGEPETARTHLERAVAILESTLGPDHVLVAGALAHLGMAHADLGDPATGLPLAERSLRIRRQVVGPRDQSVAWSLRAVAHVHLVAGDLDEARGAYAEALGIVEEAVGTDHPSVGKLRSDLERARDTAGRR